MEGWTGEWMEGWMEGWMNGRMDGASSQALLNEVSIKGQRPLPGTTVPISGAATMTFQDQQCGGR